MNLKGSSHLFKWCIAVNETHSGINFASLACPCVQWESYSLSYQFLKGGSLSWGRKISCVVLLCPARVHWNFKTVMLHLKADGDRNITTTYLLGHAFLDLLMCFTFVLAVLKANRFTYGCWPAETYALDGAFSSNDYFNAVLLTIPSWSLHICILQHFTFLQVEKILHIVCSILSNYISVKAFLAYSP